MGRGLGGQLFGLHIVAIARTSVHGSVSRPPPGGGLERRVDTTWFWVGWPAAVASSSNGDNSNRERKEEARGRETGACKQSSRRRRNEKATSRNRSGAAVTPAQNRFVPTSHSSCVKTPVGVHAAVGNFLLSELVRPGIVPGLGRRAGWDGLCLPVQYLTTYLALAILLFSA
ncbi:hypothetical protein GQ53DRAFT_751313 [Thozetella sp. PMI_491]|nr:hypothetical protein GQ53DRAFT_751313 [Thozetella sp. PMI_491]